MFFLHWKGSEEYKNLNSAIKLCTTPFPTHSIKHYVNISSL